MNPKLRRAAPPRYGPFRMHGQYDQIDFRADSAELASGIDAVQQRYREVHQNDVRVQFQSDGQQRPVILHLSDNFKLWLEDFQKGFQHQLVVRQPEATAGLFVISRLKLIGCVSSRGSFRRLAEIGTISPRKSRIRSSGSTTKPAWPYLSQIIRSTLLSKSSLEALRTGIRL
jgi:hypothetical protein